MVSEPETQAKHSNLDIVSRGSSASLMSASSTQSPATSTTVSGRTSPWTEGGADAMQPRKPVLIMNIDIGDGRTGRLEIHTGNDCDELAAEFCKTYNLPAQFVQMQLSQQIARSMATKGLTPCGGTPKPDVSVQSEEEESSEEDASSADEAPDPDSWADRHSHSAMPASNRATGDDNMMVKHGPGSSPDGMRHKHEIQRIQPNSRPANTAAFSRFAALEPLEISKCGMARDCSNRTSTEKSIHCSKSQQSSHERLYERGMRMLHERKSRLEENAKSICCTSPRKQATLAPELIPGRHTRSRARSAPRQRSSQETICSTDTQDAAASGQEINNSSSFGTQHNSVAGKRPASMQTKHFESPSNRSRDRTPSRTRGTLTVENCQRKSPSQNRAKSAPRERPSNRDSNGAQIPGYERLFNLASRYSPVNEAREGEFQSRAPWSAAGTHWQRAERQRMSSTAYTPASERLHSNRAHEGTTLDETIHERLYRECRLKMSELQEKAEAKRKQDEEEDKLATRRRRLISARSEELLAQKESFGSADVFDKLYEEGIEKIEERQRLHEQKMKAREAEALRARESFFLRGKKVPPFQPDLSKTARAFKRDEPWEDRINSIVEQKKQQDEANRLERELFELSECTFCPQISRHASQQKRDVQENRSVHEELYEHAKIWRSKQESTPSTPLESTKKVTRAEEEAVVERLHASSRSRNASPIKHQNARGAADSRTPFRPGGCKSPHWKASLEPVPRRAKSPDSHQFCDLEISEKLFSHSKLAEQAKALMLEQKERELSIMSSTKVTGKSQKLLEVARDQQLAMVFSALDVDSIGHIRGKGGKLYINVGDSTLNEAIASIIRKQLKSSTQRITFEVFKRLCSEKFKMPLPDGFSAWNKLTKIQQSGLNLLDIRDSTGIEIPFDTGEDDRKRAVEQVLNIPPPDEALTETRPQKNKGGPDVYARLLEKNSEKERHLEAVRRHQLQTEIEECYFYPRINKTSGASQPRRQSATFYERLLEKQKEKEIFLEEERQKKAADAMKECTFRPNVSKHRSRQQSSTAHPGSSRHVPFDAPSMDLGSTFAAERMSTSLHNSAIITFLDSPARFSVRELQEGSRGFTTN